LSNEKLSEQAPALVVMHLIEAIIRQDAPLASDIEFYQGMRLEDETRAFKLPFIHIFPLTRRQQEFESPQRYQQSMVVAVDLNVHRKDPDKFSRLWEYEDQIEDAIIGQLQLKDFINLLPGPMDWVKFRYIGTSYEDDQEDEMAVDNALIQFEAIYVKNRDV